MKQESRYVKIYPDQLPADETNLTAVHASEKSTSLHLSAVSCLRVDDVLHGPELSRYGRMVASDRQGVRSA